MRRFLFMAGEWAVSMPLAFADEEWSHTNTARTLIQNDNGRYSRFNINENIEGLIYFASVDNKQIRRKNLELLARNNVPCWPNPGKLLRIDDRFTLLKECVDAGFVDHQVDFLTWNDRHTVTQDLPYVLKVGNCHQGEGKFLIHGDKMDHMEHWEGVASAEPYFMGGKSMRALFIGKEEFALEFTNPESWIKNSAGADCTRVAPPEEMMRHGRRVRDCFDLEVCGIDYVLDPDGTPHFLEFNCFPGVGSDDDVSNAARAIFRQKMDIVASEANSRSEQHTLKR